MEEQIRKITKPRCFLVYALAPDDLSAAEANRIFNAFIADRDLPLALYHDHFIGTPGGLAVFYVEDAAHRDTLLGQTYLAGWRVEYRPLIYSHSPAAFDEQIAFTLRAYHGLDWEQVQRIQRPAYGDLSREAETARED